MDLNLLYSQHQISLIRASCPTNGPRRAFHETLANGFARRIALFRQEMMDDAAFRRSGAEL